VDVNIIGESDVRLALAAIDQKCTQKCWVGFDGFIDEIFRVVDRRSHGQPTFMDSIGQLAHRIPSSGSTNIEIVGMQQRIGGNATQLAQGLVRLQQPCTLTACVGYPSVEPIFKELAQSEIELINLAAPAITKALEFDDGKLMLGEMRSLLQLDWRLLHDRIGQQCLAELWQRSDVVATVNWTMTPSLGEIWQHLDQFDKGPKWLFVDLCDPAKRSDSELLDDLTILSKMRCQVIIGLNQPESRRLAKLFSVPPELDVAARAQEIKEKSGLACVVIHTREVCALAAEAQGWQLSLPAIPNPKTLTGAGDRFNAGLLFGLLQTDDLAVALCCGIAASRWYVANGTSATRENLRTVLTAMLAH